MAFVGIILISALPGLLAYPYVNWRLGKNIRNSGAYLLSSMLSNTGILGGLCAYIAMGAISLCLCPSYRYGTKYFYTFFFVFL